MKKFIRAISLVISTLALLAATGTTTDGVSQVAYTGICLLIFLVFAELWSLMDHNISRNEKREGD